MASASTADLLIGAEIGAAGTAPVATTLDPASLTTHGVIVGMTGSGKTGLGVVLIEEALRAGIPTLVLDPKGDLTNLCLRFDELSPQQFAPWVDPTQATRDGIDVDTLAAQTAQRWRDGLAKWDLGASDIANLSACAPVAIYTPGSSAGLPLNVVGSLQAPPGRFEDDAENLRAEIAGYVTGLLALAGVDADPVAAPEVALMATIIERAWTEGRSLALADLLGQVTSPPFRKLGVFDVDTFFPPAARTKLALRLNGLLASPSFAPWLQGPPIDIAALLGSPGNPRCPVIYLAHLSEEQRQFVVTLLLSKMVTWMRRQSGTSDLRALVYMDEVAGYAPPTAAPPSKAPILTLLKQARAYGVGLVLSTQNPVDLDYKAMSNAGTWMVGRLQTKRDKARILEGLSSAGGGIDTATLDDAIGGLDKRQFVLHRTGGQAPVVFGTRWALSYLRGPLTLTEIAALPQSADLPSAAASPDSADAAAPPLGANETRVAPQVADNARVAWLDPAAEWAADVGAVATPSRYIAAVVARVHLRYDDARKDVRLTDEWEAVWCPPAAELDPADCIPVDFDDRDFLDAPPADVGYVLPDAKIHTKAFFTKAGADLKRHLVREEERTLLHNADLKLYSRVDETEAAFRQRCLAAANDAADDNAATIAKRYRDRLERERKQADAAAARVQQAETDVSTRRTDELVGGATQLLGALFGGGGSRRGRRALSTLSGSTRRRGVTSRANERLDTLRAKLADEEADIVAVEQELADALAALGDEAQDTAAAIEEVALTLSAADVTIDDLAVVWVPSS